jgi:hypothetical protein
VTDARGGWENTFVVAVEVIQFVMIRGQKKHEQCKDVE